MKKTDIAVRETAASLARTWSECEAQIRSAFSTLTEAEAKLEAAFGKSSHEFSIAETLRRGSMCNPEHTLLEFRARAWDAIFDRLGVRQFLSVKAAGDLAQQLADKRDIGPIDEAAILATVNGLRAQVDDFAAAAVKEVFDFLRPRRSRLKTNKLWQVGKKVILEGYLEPGNGVMHWRPSCLAYHGSHQEERLQALARVFCLLDGRPYESRTYGGEILDALRTQATAEFPTAETQYFRMKAFRNGNLHVVFKRRDLVLRLNQVAGGAHLKPASGEL